MTSNAELTCWLAHATLDLCEDAKTRIAEEIEAHYRLTVSEMRSEGMSTEEAEQRAVASLGNPKKARRAFRKIHFTREEAEILERFSDPGPPILTNWLVLTVVYFFWAPLLITGLVLGIQRGSAWCLLVVLIGTVLVGPAMVGMRLSHIHLYRKRQVITKLKIRLFLDAIFIFGYLICGIVYLAYGDFARFLASFGYIASLCYFLPLMTRGHCGTLYWPLWEFPLLWKLRRFSAPAGSIHGPLAQ